MWQGDESEGTDLSNRLSEWFKHERLYHYPELASFAPPEALKRLQTYEKEERDAIQPWLTLIYILIVVFMVLWACLLYFKIASGLMIVGQIPLFVTQYLLYRRIRRRVQIRVAAELRDGRVWTCLECGYDLRATAERCPECGEAVRSLEPTS